MSSRLTAGAARSATYGAAVELDDLSPSSVFLGHNLDEGSRFKGLGLQL